MSIKTPNKNPKTIFLCGFMGSGKTSLGKKTAKLLGLDFIDLDDFIEQNENKKIPDIFAREGETAFRSLETEYLKKIIVLRKGTLIALGGGTVCFHNNLELVKKNGLLIYLELPAAALVKRLIPSKKERPLLSKLNDEELLDYVQSTLEKRRPFYEQAHLRIKGIDLDAEHLKNEILSFS